ncbi:MAG TPA: hypothetical protein VKB48_07640, partial [Candidatus Acidoferrum sp.]|nr:hypothetical protein [Candidatus Acidoferrum sp.]
APGNADARPVGTIGTHRTQHRSIPSKPPATAPVTPGKSPFRGFIAISEEEGSSQPRQPLGSPIIRDGLALTLYSSQFVTQTRRFVAISLSLNMVFGGAHASHGMENFADAVIFALAHMFELAGEILLVEGVGFDSVNPAVQILNVRPTLRLVEARVMDRAVAFCHAPSPCSSSSEVKSSTFLLPWILPCPADRGRPMWFLYMLPS